MEIREYNKDDVEHLRMLQGIINRLANTSLGIKRYALMVFTFGCSYLLINPTDKNKYLLLLVIFIFIMMIFCDMYYLSMERAYRNKFNEDRLSLDKNQLFDLSIQKLGLREYFRTLFSKSIYLFYSPLLIAIIAIFLYFSNLVGNTN